MLRFTNKVLSVLIISIAVSCFGCVKPVVIEGTAMSPALKSGDKIFLTTNFGNLERGEIISFLYPKDKTKWFIKRVIGLPNETIEIKNGKVFIDDVELEEPYLDHHLNQSLANYGPRKVPGDNYFVLGDNRDNSSDSRIWGSVPKTLIQGKFWYKYSSSDKE